MIWEILEIPPKQKDPICNGVGLFVLTVFTYSWSLLLAEKRLDIFYLRSRFSLVFWGYRGNLVWSYLVTVQNRFGPFYLQFPSCLEIEFGLLYLWFPTISQKTNQ